MDATPPPPDRRDTLTRALVQHVRECFADYAEVELSGAGTAPVPRPPRGVPRLAVDVRDGRLPGRAPAGAGRGDRRVLVLCACTDDPAPERPPAPGPPVDVVEVRRASEIAGAVAESTAGDLPLVVDVRLTCAEAERLLPGAPAPG